MALLLGNIDLDSIPIIRRCKINEMLRYIHVKSCHLIQIHASMMFSVGYGTLIPVAHTSQMAPGVGGSRRGYNGELSDKF